MSILTGTDLSFGSVSVTADGVKTYRQLFAELYNLADTDRITINSKIRYAVHYFLILQRTYGGYFFTYTNLTTTGAIDILTFCLNSNSANCYFFENKGGPITDLSDNIAPSGTLFELLY